MELAADKRLLKEVFDGALLALEGALVLVRAPFGLLVLVAREGAGGLLDAALGLVRRSLDLVLAAPLGHYSFLPFFGWSSELDLGSEELKYHYYQYDDHHYPDDPVRHALTSSGHVLLRHIGHKDGGVRYTAVPLRPCDRPGPVVIPYDRLEDAATAAGAGATEPLPFERLAQRSFRPLSGPTSSVSPLPKARFRVEERNKPPPGKAGERGERTVFVRMTFTKSDPDSLEAVRASYYRDEIWGVLERQEGHRFHHHLLESVDVPGEGVSVSAWDGREDAEAYERSGAYDELVAKFGNFYTGPARLASYEVRE